MSTQPFFSVWSSCLPTQLDSSVVSEYWLVGDMSENRYIVYKNFKDVSSKLDISSRFEIESIYRSVERVVSLNSDQWMMFVSKHSIYSHMERVHMSNVSVVYRPLKGSNHVNKDEFFYAPSLEIVSRYLNISFDNIKRVMRGSGFIPNCFIRDNLADVSILEMKPDVFLNSLIEDKCMDLYTPDGCDVDIYWGSRANNFRTR
jgi:hypothetical protein